MSVWIALFVLAAIPVVFVRAEVLKHYVSVNSVQVPTFDITLCLYSL